MRRHLVNHMEVNELFNPSQHGFRNGRSCLSQLLAHFDLVTRLMEEGKSVDVIYLDFSKAFDKVDIGVTLRKLKSIGISGKVGRWLQSFLTGHQQSEVINREQSDPQPVLSGVPQGSVLGPLLFLVLIGDIDEGVVALFLSSFADDTRITHGISSQDDTEALQQDLRAVYLWAKKNNMEFNSDKFELLRYSHRGYPPTETIYQADNDQEIEVKSSLHDLGVTVSDDASFSTYIMEKASAMKLKVGWVIRTFKRRDKYLMILSDHDYCSQQRSFLSKIRGIHHFSYWDQLKELKLYSLERRRERYIAIYIWRILEGSAPNISDSHGITFKWHPTRGRVCIVPPSHLVFQLVYRLSDLPPLQSRDLEFLTPCLGA